MNLARDAVSFLIEDRQARRAHRAADEDTHGHVDEAKVKAELLQKDRKEACGETYRDWAWCASNVRAIKIWRNQLVGKNTHVLLL